MSISNAIQFIKTIDENADFRASCNKCLSKEVMHEMLIEKELPFDAYDFQEAINILLFRCQTYEQANSIKQVELWYSLL